MFLHSFLDGLINVDISKAPSTNIPKNPGRLAAIYNTCKPEQLYLMADKLQVNLCFLLRIVLLDIAAKLNFAMLMVISGIFC